MSEEKEVLDELTPEEMQELQQYLVGSAPQPEEKHNTHKFLHDISIADDTLKTGNLTAEELGMPKHPVRTAKELELFCRDVANMEYMAYYFKKEAEIITSTSLSKDAKLINLAVLTRRELGDVTKQAPKENKGWFKKKKGGEE